MRRIKTISVIAVFILCSSIASAYSYAAGGGDWNSLSTWYESTTGAPTGALPTVSTPVYLQYTSPTGGPYSPVYINAGQTGECAYPYVSLYDGYGGGGIDVEGTLNCSGIYFGNWWLDSTPVTDFVMNIGDNGVVNIGAAYGLSSTSKNQYNTQVFNVNGGTLDIAGSVSGAGTSFEFNVSSDGYLRIAGDISGVDGSSFTIDLTDANAQLVLQGSVFNNLISYGSILANGVIVTTSNMNTLLNVDTASSPGNAVVTLKIVSPPDPAFNPSPANSTTSIPLTTELTWTAGNGATSHNVYFGTNSTPDAGESKGNQTETTYNPGILTYGTTYYWRIDEVNDYGTTTGTVWSFTTVPAPATASIPSPGDGATNVTIDSGLSWTAGEYALSHDVYLGTSLSAVTNAQRPAGDINGDGSVDINDLAVLGFQWLTNPGEVNPSADVIYSGNVDMEDFAVVAADWGLSAEPEFMGNQAETTFDPVTLNGNTTYYWRVDEVNASNPGSPWTGAVWSFTTELIDPPAAPSSPSPGDGDVNVSLLPVLSWAEAAGATSYNLYGGTVSPPSYQKSQTGTTWEITGALEYDTTYYWQIEAVNDYGTTKSPIWSFTTSSMLTPEEFPIIPWSAPWRNWGPAFSTSVLEDVRDCGFNIGGFLQPSQLNYAAAAGIKGIVFYDPYPYGLYCHVYGTGEGASVDMTNLTQTEVDQRAFNLFSWVGSNSALFAYYLRDEPGANIYPVLGKFVDAFHRLDPDHLSIINLFPNYASSTQMQVSNYNTYVSNYMSTVNPDYVCYDHYGITDSLSVTSTYWSNLETIRSYAMSHNKPFWQIVCSVKRTGWPTPSMATLRFQLYSSLAYGAKGIGYWMYFNWPAPQLIDGTWWFTPEHTLAPIDINGNKTATWYYLQAVNTELHTIGRIYLTLNNVGVYHNSSPSGWSISGGSLVIGDFDQIGTGQSFVMVVNKSLTSSANVTVSESLPGSVYYVSPTDGQFHPLSGNLTLEPGEGRLLTVQ